MSLMVWRKICSLISTTIYSMLSTCWRMPGMYYSSCRTAVEPGQLTLFSDGAVHVCRCAIDFLECEFSQRNPQVKAVTSKGSELDTIAFRSEDPSGRKVCIHPLSLLTPAANTFNQCRLPCLRSCVAIAPEAKLSSNLFKKCFIPQQMFRWKNIMSNLSTAMFTHLRRSSDKSSACLPHCHYPPTCINGHRRTVR